MTFEIREATPEDAEVVALLFHETIREVNIGDYSREQVQAWAGAAPEPDKWRQRLLHKQTFLACFLGQVVGFAEFEPDGHIDALYVHHAHQGRGVATAMLDRIEQEAARLGLARLYTEASMTARPFFEHRGFVVSSAQDVEYRGMVFRNYRMEKQRSFQQASHGAPSPATSAARPGRDKAS